MAAKKVRLSEHNIRRVLKSLLEIYEPMQRGQEEKYNLFFFAIDSNILKTNRINPKCNSRRAREAVDICLATIDGYLNNLEYDFSEFGNPENLALAKAMQMAYDPQVNSDATPKLLKKLEDRDGRREFYEVPFKCLYRLRDSIDFWIKRSGADGYIDMINGDIGAEVPYDQEMNFVFSV